MILALVVVLLVAGVLSAGIWAVTRYADRDSWAGRGTPVTTPRVPPDVTQTGQPPAALEPVKQILYRLKDRVLRSAGVPRPVDGSCDRAALSGAEPAVLRCNDGIPSVALVPVNAPLDRYCWAKPHRGKTVKVSFRPSDQGQANLFTEVQGP